jgi:gliding motility-associated-like protein
MNLNAVKANILCPPLQNGYISLSVSGGSPAYSYTWSTGATGSQISGLNVGSYQVVVTDSRGCTEDSSFVIVNDSAFSIRGTPDTATINEGDAIQLGIVVTSNGAGYANAVWTPDAGLSCSTCADPMATPFTSTQYIINAVSDSGCTASTQISITVNTQHQLYVPNGFTPNGDGINDVWEAFGNKKVWIFCEAEVWDRWGEKIFQSTDINFQWDGKYKGTLVEPGEYVYTLKVVFLDDYTVSNKGGLTVIR